MTDGVPLVGLVTIWYRSAPDLDRFLADLKGVQYPNLRHVFVINDQTASEVDRLKTNAPGALVIEPRANLGTAAGWNLGIRRLLTEGAKYIGIWNPDVKLASDGLEHLVTVMEHDESIGAVGPLIFWSDDPGTVQMFGGSIDIRNGLANHDYMGESNLETLPALHDAEYLDGGTMLLRAEVLRQVGGFDEEFFMYGEDSDISFRIRRAGYRLVAVRSAWAWHFHRENKGHFPSPYELFYITRNRFRLVSKHGNQRDWWLLAALAIGTLPRRMFYFLRRRKLRLGAACVSGVISGLVGRAGKDGWVD
ncbi:MAG: glycosyltransferase family 2 protein [Chloroflexi bacterium]|nr:glycosyltransferase family 2 protein [Chloroflexota bacterium]